MRVPRDYVSQWFGFWSSVADRSFTSWQRASEEIEERTYGVDELLSDVIDLWSYGAIAGWAAMWGGDRRLPTLFFSLAKDDRSATDSILKQVLPVFKPSLPAVEPTVAFLRRIDRGKEEIAIENCYAKLEENELVVRLQGLPDELEPAVYEGLVHVGNVPLAHLYIHVTPATRPKRRPSATDLLIKKMLDDPNVSRLVAELELDHGRLAEILRAPQKLLERLEQSPSEELFKNAMALVQVAFSKLPAEERERIKGLVASYRPIAEGGERARRVILEILTTLGRQPA